MVGINAFDMVGSLFGFGLAYLLLMGGSRHQDPGVSFSIRAGVFVGLALILGFMVSAVLHIIEVGLMR